eukprot:6175790-Pleurochrysis_carterae.AAC.1
MGLEAEARREIHTCLQPHVPARTCPLARARASTHKLARARRRSLHHKHARARASTQTSVYGSPPEEKSWARADGIVSVHRCPLLYIAFLSVNKFAF